jgi:Domain of unknown function (DUF6378)
MNDSTTALLAERGKTHGDFTDHALITQTLKNACNSRRGWNNLTPEQREAIDMILHKIGRILAGDPSHKDHWDDIAGYARLVSERLP